MYALTKMKNQSKVFTVHSNQKDIATVTPKRSFHSSLKWILVVAQCFGQMPVAGISKRDVRFLKFTWKSWRSLYCILNCTGAGFLAITYLYQSFTYGPDILHMFTMIFSFNALLVTILFLKLATEWPNLMRKWYSLEFSMRSYGWPLHLHTRINIIAITVLTLAAVETTMAKVRGIILSIRHKNDIADIFEYYFTVLLYPKIFASVSYSLWKGIVLQIVNVYLTFAWSFNDLFIMLVSTALAVRFKQITSRLRLLQKNCKIENLNIWREIREDYTRVCQLVRNVDNALSYVVLLSFGGNLYSIIMQLFYSMKPMTSIAEKVYFSFSFGFIILRTISVSLYGAWIHDESREPIGVLNSISSEVYNIEIKRFMEQIKFETVALTGKNFFYITRGIILSMAGVIVTYELVLIQFNDDLVEKGVLPATNGSR